MSERGEGLWQDVRNHRSSGPFVLRRICLFWAILSE